MKTPRRSFDPGIGIAVLVTWIAASEVAAATPRRLSGTGVPSVTASGHSRDPRLSEDGGVVVFESTAPDLVASDVNGGVADVFARSLPDGAVEWVSATPSGGSGNARSYGPVVSADGRYVAFTSEASDLVEGDGNGTTDVFVRDRARGVTTLASVMPAGVNPKGRSAGNPALTPDGRFVVFESRGTNGLTDVHLRDVASGITHWISRPMVDLPGSVGATDPQISADGESHRILEFVDESGAVSSEQPNHGIRP